MGRRAAATFASEVDDDAEAREVDALARRSHLGSSVTGCRRGSEGLGERKARTARRGVAVRRVVTTTHQHGTPVGGGWVGVVAVLAVRLDVAVAEDPHRPSRYVEPRRLERLRQTLGGASPRLRGGERALRARDAGARPRHRRERREHHGATRERAHDDGSDARAPPSCARPHAASGRRHHDEPGVSSLIFIGRTNRVRSTFRTSLFPRSFSLAHDDRYTQAVRSLMIHKRHAAQPVKQMTILQRALRSVAADAIDIATPSRTSTNGETRVYRRDDGRCSSVFSEESRGGSEPEPVARCSPLAAQRMPERARERIRVRSVFRGIFNPVSILPVSRDRPPRARPRRARRRPRRPWAPRRRRPPPSAPPPWAQPWARAWDAPGWAWRIA